MRYALSVVFFVLFLCTDVFAFHLVCTGDTWNYLEPCPVCGGRAQGGMARRATAFSQIRQSGDILPVDSGGLVELRAKETSVRDLGIQLNVLAKLGYAAVNVTAHDLPFLARLDRAAPVPLVSAMYAGADVGLSEIRAWTVVERDGLRIGITGVGVTTSRTRETDGNELDAMASALGPVLKDLHEHCDLLVVLAYAPGRAGLELLDRYPEIDVVVSDSLELLEEWSRPGRVLVSPVQKGMSVKTVEVVRRKDTSFDFSPENRIALDASMPDDVAIRDLVAQMLTIPGPGMPGAAQSRAEQEEQKRLLSLTPQEFIQKQTPQP